MGGGRRPRTEGDGRGEIDELEARREEAEEDASAPLAIELLDDALFALERTLEHADAGAAIDDLGATERVGARGERRTETNSGGAAATENVPTELAWRRW